VRREAAPVLHGDAASPRECSRRIRHLRS